MFVIFWRGWGIAVPFIAAAGIVVASTIAAIGLGVEAVDRYFLAVTAAGLALAAPVVWKLGRRLHRGAERTLVDAATGETVIISRRHTFYFLRMEYWGAVLGGVAVLFLGLSAVGGAAVAAGEPQVGGLYTTLDGEGYSVVKVLAVEDDAVHVRLYSETFDQRPDAVDPAILSVGDTGILYLAVDEAAFDATDPELLRVHPVTAEELAGRADWETYYGGHVFTIEELTVDETE